MFGPVATQVSGDIIESCLLVVFEGHHQTSISAQNREQFEH